MQGTNRVWVQLHVVEAIRNPKVPRYGSTSKLTLRKAGSNFSDADSSSDVGSVSGGPSSAAGANTGRTQQWGWTGGLMMSQSTSAIAVKLDDDGETIALSPTALQDGHVVLGNDYVKNAEGSIIPPNDLITLTHLHEPAVVHCLLHRYKEDLIYTATGPVLLALNPFKSIPRLYGESSMKRYWDKAEKNLKADLPPHVYQIADASFRNMMRKIEASLEDPALVDANQAILVSGESGAGKTVTTKFVMKYLAALSQRASAPHVPVKRAYLKVEEKRAEDAKVKNWASPPPSAAATNRNDSIQFSSNSIESKVLQSNPILESFGNARTIRNDNSSRFGKFIEIQFTQTGRLVGATIDTYLLEKVRLVTQSPGERNYHVFFELLSGMDPKELSHYFLARTATPEDFFMMHSGTQDRRDGVADADTYKSLRVAMNTMNFAPREQKNIFSVTAALLHASNIVFIERDNDESELDRTNIHLEPACQLLGITAAALNEALCTFSIQAGRDGYVKRSLDKRKAEKCLEALIKATYGAMFQYLVMRINDSIAYHPDEEEEEDLLNIPVATIGVLDIFGFESFTTNSFEQLCINYCNEALQQQFNAFVLKNEQSEYEREGIEWSFIEFPENQDVLDLIDKRGSGILNILDDQCRAPGTTDRSFASDVYSKCTGHSRFRANRKQVAVFQFEVHHYAGFVEYTTDGFVEKNRDEMHNESTVLLANSTNPFVCFLSEVLSGEALPPSNDSASDINTPYNLRRSESSAMKATVGGQFRRQLRELRFKIDKTAPHYVRCLKPNDHLVADDFDPVIVAEQLRCGGILEAVRVSRAGFPQHYPHAEFCKRYRCVATRDMKKAPAALENGASARPTWAAPAPQKKWQPPRGGAFRGSFSPPAHATSSQNTSQPDVVNYMELCKELLKVIYRKVQAFEAEENKENGLVDSQDVSTKKHEQPAAKAKSYSGYSSSPPAWSKSPNSQSLSTPATNNGPPTSSASSVKSRYQPWTKPESSMQTPPNPSTRAYSGNFRRGAVDFSKVGIQLGKTKVFLRHSAFETLERLRSRELTSAATKLNSIFRMYLCRLAYVPVRNAFRAEMRNRGVFAKETKENFPSSNPRGGRSGPMNSDNSSASRLIAVFESEVRASIHNPTSRNQASVEAPTKFFKWVLLEGIWVKNPMIPNDPEGIAQ